MINQPNKDYKQIAELREYKVVKSNDLIQKSRFSLSNLEQKIVLFVISKIKPEDKELKEQIFSIVEFCEVCGIYKESGKNYTNIKNTLKKLRDKSMWITLENGIETTVSWINKASISKNSGFIKIRLDDDLKPYLLDLQEKFTQYELIYTLGMKSQYSIRFYEFLLSHEWKKVLEIDIEDFKKVLSAEVYKRFADFKRKVLDIAIRETNELSNIEVTYELTKKGRSYSKIKFFISKKKEDIKRLETYKNIYKQIAPEQVSFFDQHTTH